MILSYLQTLFRFSGLKTWQLMGLMVALGLTQGIGLAMIIPFLHVIGIDVSKNGSGYAGTFARAAEGFGASPGLFTVILFYIVVISAYALANRKRDILSAKLTFGFTHYLRTRLYEKFCGADWVDFLSIRDAEIIHVLTHDTQRVAVATQQLFQLLASGLLVTIYILFSMSISLAMTCTALFCGGLFLILLRPFNRKAVRFGLSFRNANSDIYSLITEHIGGMKVSKSYGLEQDQKTEFFRASGQACEQTVRFTRINTATRLFYQVGAAAAIALFIALGLRLFHLSAVNLMVIVFLFSRILPGLSNLQQIFQRIANAMPSFQAILDLEKELVHSGKPVTVNKSPGTSPVALTQAICLDRVWFRYDTGQGDWALEDVQVTIPANKITAIVGHSGAGKTTLADMILGLLPPERGRFRIDGAVPNETGLMAWRQCVGYVPQETYLFHESIRSNLEKARPEATESELWDALERASAKDFVSRLPQGLDTVVGDRGIRLSGGERQRIALARALLRNPRLLVLDEATSSLDRDNEKHIRKAFEKLKGRLTIVVIAHRSFTVENADQLIRLEKGRVIDVKED